MKKVLAVLLMAMVMLGLLCACERTSSETYTSPEELDGKLVLVETGASYYELALDYFDDPNVSTLDSISDIIQALKCGNAEGAIVDRPMAEIIARENTAINFIDENLSEESFCFIVNKADAELKEKMDAVICEYRENGTIDALYEKWVYEDDPVMDPTLLDNTGRSGETLTVNHTGDYPGFDYLTGGSYGGFEVELVLRIARELDMPVDFRLTTFSGMLTSVNLGLNNVGIGFISYREERTSSVLFTEPVLESGAVIIVRDNAALGNESLFAHMAGSFRRAVLVDGRWLVMAKGLLVTVEITVLSLLFGGALGYVFGYALRSRRGYVRFITAACSTIWDGLPTLVILLILYYVLFSEARLSPFWVSVACFTLDFCNTSASIVNTGINAIGDGQAEAAKALGYSRWRTFTDILYPQALKNMADPLRGSTVSLLKNTAVVGYITVDDLTAVTDIIRSRTFESLVPLLFSALLYFVLARGMILVFQLVEPQIELLGVNSLMKGVKRK